jgi:hypothetical protein
VSNELTLSTRDGRAVDIRRTVRELATWAGPEAAAQTLEFPAAGIHNPNTREAYHRATRRFMRWCRSRDLALHAVTGAHVGLYIKELGESLAILSVKQHLAALRHWGDWLVRSHVLETKRWHGPPEGRTHVKTRGKLVSALWVVGASIGSGCALEHRSGVPSSAHPVRRCSGRCTKNRDHAFPRRAVTAAYTTYRRCRYRRSGSRHHNHSKCPRRRRRNRGIRRPGPEIGPGRALRAERPRRERAAC